MLRAPASRSSKAATSTRDPIDMVVGYSNVDAAREMTRYLIARYAVRSATSARSRRTTIARATGAWVSRRACRSGEAAVDPRHCIETTLDLDAGARRWRRCSTRPGRAPCSARPTRSPSARCSNASAAALAVPGRSRSPASTTSTSPARRARAHDDARAALRDRPARRQDDLRPARRARRAASASSTSAIG